MVRNRNEQTILSLLRRTEISYSINIKGGERRENIVSAAVIAWQKMVIDTKIVKRKGFKFFYAGIESKIIPVDKRERIKVNGLSECRQTILPHVSQLLAQCLLINLTFFLQSPLAFHFKQDT